MAASASGRSSSSLWLLQDKAVGLFLYVYNILIESNETFSL